jgi:TetR/AcrR family tetracycline transcriptional repressor
MKINRDMVTQAALALLDEIGLEQLTLRRLAVQLNVQAPTLYWHFQSKQELLDEMATTVLTQGAHHLLPRRRNASWILCASTFGHGLRSILLAHRDGARMVAATRLTRVDYLRTTEAIAARLLAADFNLRHAIVLLGVVYNYTLSFTAEEQAVFPTPGKRSPAYSLSARNARLDPALFPLHRRATPILFDNYDRRFREGLRLILAGASTQISRASTPRRRARAS